MKETIRKKLEEMRAAVKNIDANIAELDTLLSNMGIHKDVIGLLKLRRKLLVRCKIEGLKTIKKLEKQLSYGE